MADKIKLACAALLVVAGVVGYYYLKDSATIVRAGSVRRRTDRGVGGGLDDGPGQAACSRSRRNRSRRRARSSGRRARRRCRRPAIVFVFILLMALFLWLVDATLLWVVKLIMGRD